MKELTNRLAIQLANCNTPEELQKALGKQTLAQLKPKRCGMRTVKVLCQLEAYGDHVKVYINPCCFKNK